LPLKNSTNPEGWLAAAVTLSVSSIDRPRPTTIEPTFVARLTLGVIGAATTRVRAGDVTGAKTPAPSKMA
jgi:hypothetical protein